MNYLDAGYSNLLSREILPSNTEGYDPLAFDYETQEISGQKIQGGVLQSEGGKSQLNLEKDYFAVSDGTQDIIRLGVQEDGSIGLVIINRDGQELLRFTGDKNYLKSPNANLEMNFDDVQIIVRDDKGTPVGLIGKQVGGF